MNQSQVNIDKNNELSLRVKAVIRDIPDFPKPGIVFKDLTPILKDASLCIDIRDVFVTEMMKNKPDAIVGLESRGFWFGLMIAAELNVPFIPIRKPGKLPYKTISQSYSLEYGENTVEIHEDALLPNAKVWIHDDLLATGGTAEAAAKLVNKLGAEVVGFSFLVDLAFLNGADKLQQYHKNIYSIVKFD